RPPGRRASPAARRRVVRPDSPLAGRLYQASAIALRRQGILARVDGDRAPAPGRRLGPDHDFRIARRQPAPFPDWSALGAASLQWFRRVPVTIHCARRPAMHSAEIRQRFLNFFKERDHQVLPSSSLIPFDDPTLLFTSAGMVPFKPYFLGQRQPPYRRATTAQKVFRTPDIEEVGRDGHHLTFFEMLGNFSFGDYFKEGAIPLAYELLTRDFRLPVERLWATVYLDDEESARIWQQKTGIPPERIRRFGDEYNFWAAGP